MTNGKRGNGRSGSATYAGKTAANLPAPPLKLNSTGLIEFAAAVSKLARSIRYAGSQYYGADDADKAHIKRLVGKAIGQVSDLWKALSEAD